MKLVWRSRLHRDLAAAVFAALLAVLSQIAIPMPWGIPFTLQTFAVALCGYVLGPAWAPVAVGVYLALGAVGLPVFSGFAGGAASLLNVTGGFLWGFLPMALLCGLGSRRGKLPALLLGPLRPYGVPRLGGGTVRPGPVPAPVDGLPHRLGPVPGERPGVPGSRLRRRSGGGESPGQGQTGGDTVTFGERPIPAPLITRERRGFPPGGPSFFAGGNRENRWRRPGLLGVLPGKGVFPRRKESFLKILLRSPAE